MPQAKHIKYKKSTKRKSKKKKQKKAQQSKALKHAKSTKSRNGRYQLIPYTPKKVNKTPKKKKQRTLPYIISPPKLANLPRNVSVRDLKFEETELWDMHEDVRPLCWPADNYTKVQILKVVEYYSKLLENGEIVSDRFPWSYLINKTLIKYIPVYSKYNKPNKNQLILAPDDVRLVANTKCTNSVRSIIGRWRENADCIKINYFLAPSALKNGCGRLCDFPSDVEFNVYKRIWEEQRDYGISVTTEEIKLLLHNALLNTSEFVPFFSNECKNKWQQIQQNIATSISDDEGQSNADESSENEKNKLSMNNNHEMMYESTSAIIYNGNINNKDTQKSFLFSTTTHLNKCSKVNVAGEIFEIEEPIDDNHNHNKKVVSNDGLMHNNHNERLQDILNQSDNNVAGVMNKNTLSSSFDGIQFNLELTKENNEANYNAKKQEANNNFEMKENVNKNSGKKITNKKIILFENMPDFLSMNASTAHVKPRTIDINKTYDNEVDYDDENELFPPKLSNELANKSEISEDDDSLNENEDDDLKQSITNNEKSDFLSSFQNELDRKSMQSVNYKGKAILIDDNKVGRFKRKMKLSTINSNKSTYFNAEEVKALQFFPVAKTICYRLLVPIKFMGHHDQSWMPTDVSPRYQYAPKDLSSAAGKRKSQCSREGFTHCATAIQNVLNKKVKVGAGAIIIPSNTKDNGKSLSKTRKEQLIHHKCSLKLGINDKIGPCGLALWVSHNGWQQEYHTDENVQLLHANGKFSNMI